VATTGGGREVKATAETPFPKIFEEILEWFSIEEDCEKYLGWVRWPDGFVCDCNGCKRAALISW
jgi:hypothetical protein